LFGNEQRCGIDHKSGGDDYRSGKPAGDLYGKCDGVGNCRGRDRLYLSVVQRSGRKWYGDHRSDVGIV
jgi:hypothetical protein